MAALDAKAAPGEPGGAAALTAALSAETWREAPMDGLDPRVFTLALQATRCAVRTGRMPSLPATLTVIDYSRPSSARRLWVFDLVSRALLYRELVAHGAGSGEDVATRFSNEAETHRSSLGLFVAEDTYVGKNGYSLRLNGLEAGINNRARERAIVIHGAPYVSDEFVRRQGRLGRSWGCPALRPSIAHALIDRIKDGGAIFAYYPERDWLQTSSLLGDCASPA